MVPTILIPEVQIFVRSDISESDLQNHDFELIYEIYVNFRCGFSGTNHFGPRGSDLSQICHFWLKYSKSPFLDWTNHRVYEDNYGTKMTDLKSKMTDDYVLSLGGTKWLVPLNPHQNLTWIWYMISKSWFWRSHFEMTGLNQKWQLRLRSEPRRTKWLLPLNPHQNFTWNRYMISKSWFWWSETRSETQNGRSE